MTENIQPLPPYKGTEPYIFISYSHINQMQALKIVERLQKEGYRVWYDEGIDPGTEWDDNIAEHVLSCGYFVALISENYLASENCKDELNLAREENKPRLLVYLENVTLPAGMRMRLNRLQAIHKYKYQNEDTFIEKFKETRGIEDCFDQDALPKRGEDTPKAEQAVPKEEEPSSPNAVTPTAAEKAPVPPMATPPLKKEEAPKTPAPASAPQKKQESPVSGTQKTNASPASNAPQTSGDSADEPFVFLSYAHKDHEQVAALTEHLKAAGIRFWYDNGIEAGAEWVSNLAQRLEACAHFMPLISPNYVVSETCRRELHFATQLKKKVLPLYLEDFELPPSIELMVSIYQGMHRSNFGDEKDFFEAISALPMLKDCQKKPSAATTKPERAEAQVAKKEQTPPQSSPKGQEVSAPAVQSAEQASLRAKRKEVRMLILYAKELLEKGEKEHARQRLYAAILSAEELVKDFENEEDLSALGEAHKLLAEDFLSAGMLLEAETHFQKHFDVTKRQQGEDAKEPFLLMAAFFERLTDRAEEQKDLTSALRFADKSFSYWKTLLERDPQNDLYKTGFERIAAKEHHLQMEDRVRQAKESLDDIKKQQEKERAEAQKEQRWEDFFAGSKDVKLEPSYKELVPKPHLFIDFVQADEAKAKKIIAHLRERGYRVAYPTKGGFLKKTNVKDQVKKATVFLPLISQSYIKERGGQLDQLCSWFGVHDCFIYLERCELPQNLRLRFATKDNLKLYNYQYPRNFFNALYNTHKVKSCK